MSSTAFLQAAAASLDAAGQADYTAAIVDRLVLAAALDPVLVHQVVDEL